MAMFLNLKYGVANAIRLPYRKAEKKDTKKTEYRLRQPTILQFKSKRKLKRRKRFIELISIKETELFQKSLSA